jgi:hypothetical protein
VIMHVSRAFSGAAVYAAVDPWMSTPPPPHGGIYA